MYCFVTYASAYQCLHSFEREVIQRLCAKLYRMLHDSETWLVKKENELALQQVEVEMIRWMSGVKRNR